MGDRLAWPAGTPSAGQPIPAGYVDNDVYEAARCLHRLGRDEHHRHLPLHRRNHDHFQKAVLSLGLVNIPGQQAAEKDGEDVLDMLAAHPGTGRHLARKLCRRLIADDPPPALVETIAAMSSPHNWLAPDQLSQVYEAILLSTSSRPPGARRSSGRSSSSVSRAARHDANWNFGCSSQDPLTVEPDTSSFLSRLRKTGQNLFARMPPDGFADREAVWSGTNTRLQCWRLGSWLIDQDIDGNSSTDDFRLDVLGQTYAAFPGLPPLGEIGANWCDFWMDRVFRRPLEPAASATSSSTSWRRATVPNLAFDLDASSTVRSRVRALVAPDVHDSPNSS